MKSSRVKGSVYSRFFQARDDWPSVNLFRSDHQHIAFGQSTFTWRYFGDDPFLVTLMGHTFW